MTQAIDLPAGMPLNVAIGSVATGSSSPLAIAPAVDANGLPQPPLFVLFNKPQVPFPTVIRGLNFDQLSSYLNSYELGMYRTVTRIWNLMRRRDSHLLSVSSKRFKRVSRLDWEITPIDSSPEAITQAEFLSDFYSDIPNFKKMVRFLMTATGNGISGTEIVWKPAAGTSRKRKAPMPAPASPGLSLTSDAPQPDAQEEFEIYESLRAELIKVRTDFFDESGGELKVYPDVVSATGIPIPENKFVIHRTDDALMIAGSILFVMKQISLGQWNQFCDRFGMPGMVGTAPAGSSEASRDTLQKVVSNWVATMATVLPPGYDVKTVGAAVAGSLIPAAALVEWCDECQSILWAGGNLTTKSQAGSGTLAGGAQQDQEIELAQDDANDLAETFDEQLSAPAVKFQFRQPLLCKFNFKVAKAIDLVAMIGVVTQLVVTLGLKVAEADIRAMFGFRKPEDDEDVIKAPQQQPGAGTQPPLRITGIQQEQSGANGIALKSPHTTPLANTVQEDVNAITEAHATVARDAVKLVWDRIGEVIGDTSITSEKDLEAKLKSLAGTLPTDEFQRVMQGVVAAAFSAGSKSVKAAVDAERGQG